MHVYMAAVYTNGYMPNMNRWPKMNEREQEICHTVPHILESWHYVGRQRFVDAMRQDNARVFLDSGAFSAFTLGVTLSVADYCEYITNNQDILRREGNVVMASVLDGIGDPLQTWRNQREMEERGVRPLPCFHSNEDERYLEHYVANYEYITLGGMVGSSSAALQVWLDRVWDRYLVDGAGRPKTRVHGFGITSVPLMERYPWYSCDSSSWIQSAAFGSIVHPKHGPINVSEKSPSRHDAGQHATTLTSVEQDYLFGELEKAGFTYERLSTVYESRAAYNLWAYGVINATMNAANSEKFKIRIQELF